MANLKNQLAQVGMGTLVAGLKAVESSVSKKQFKRLIATAVERRRGVPASETLERRAGFAPASRDWRPRNPTIGRPSHGRLEARALRRLPLVGRCHRQESNLHAHCGAPASEAGVSANSIHDGENEKRKRNGGSDPDLHRDLRGAKPVSSWLDDRPETL